MTVIDTQTITVQYTDWGEYVYFATFVVSFGERAKRTSTPCHLNRLWADDFLIYDATTGKRSVDFEFFPGTDDQREVRRGMHYRDQMVIRFDSMPLTNYNDRIPVISAEIIDAPETVNILRALQPIPSPEIRYMELFGDHNMLVLGNPEYDKGGAWYMGGNPAGYGWATYNQNTKYLTGADRSFRRDVQMNADNVDDPTVIIGYSPWGRHYIVQRPTLTQIYWGDTSQSSQLQYYEDMKDEEWDTVFCQQYVAPKRPMLGVPIGGGSPGSYTPGEMLPGEQSTLGILAKTGLSKVRFFRTYPYYSGQPGRHSTTWEPASPVLALARGRSLEGTSEVLAATQDGVHALGVDIDRRASNGVTLEETLLFTPATGVPYQLFHYREGYITLVKTNPTDHEGYAVYRTYEGDTVWQSEPFTLPNQTSLYHKTMGSSADLSRNRLLMRRAGSDTELTSMDLATGAVTLVIIPFATNMGDDEAICIWDSRNNRFYIGGNQYIAFDVPDLTSNTIGSAIESLAERAGYPNGAVSIVGMDTEVMPGYIMTDGSLIDFLNDLALLYNFNFSDEAGQLTVIRPYTDTDINVTLTLEETDLSVLSEGQANNRAFTRHDSEELPYKLELSYFNINSSYDAGEETAARRKFPLPTVHSDGKASFAVPISLTEREAAERLEAALVRMWSGQNSASIRVDSQYIEIKPGEVIQYTVDTVTYTGIVADKYVNADNSLSLALNDVPANTYPVELDPQGPVQPPQAVLGTPVRALVVDAPALTPSMDVQGQLQALTVLAPYSEGEWPGFARLDMQRLNSAEGWTPRFATDAPGKVGYMMGGLAPVTSPFETDYVNTLVVSRGSIPLEDFQTATYAEMLAGANFAIIGRDGVYEYIQYGDVEVVDDQTIALSRLFRGRLGTDTHTNLVTNGWFILLDNIGVLQYDVSTYQAADGFAYRSYTPGQSPDETKVNVYYPMGNSRKPHAPNDVRAERAPDGDILFTWKRRTRFGPEMQDGVGYDELDEDVEAYALDIYDPTFNTVVRRVSNINAPNWTYDLDAQIEDGLNVETELNTLVFQINTTHVGRGFGGGGVIPVVDLDALGVAVQDNDTFGVTLDVSTGALIRTDMYDTDSFGIGLRVPINVAVDFSELDDFSVYSQGAITATHWRVRWVVSSDANFAGIQECIFNQAPVSGGTVLFSSQFNDGSFAASNAFDDKVDPWVSVAGQNTNAYIGYQFATPIWIDTVALANYNSGYSPTSFVVEYSSDGVTWEEAASFSGFSSWTTAGQIKLFDVNTGTEI